MQQGASVVTSLVPNKARKIGEMGRSDPKAWQKIVIGSDTIREIMVKDYPALSRLARPDLLYQMTG